MRKANGAATSMPRSRAAAFQASLVFIGSVMARALYRGPAHPSGERAFDTRLAA